ncbi:MAG: polysaccharide deacetylase family protein [Pyrinomonadaceae bacterium]
MKSICLLFSLFCILFVTSSFSQSREVAITIDDLPVVVKNSNLEKRQDITKRLLANIKAARVPVIGFVNENKLYVGGNLSDPDVQLLRQWLNQGLDLGNHTYSHMSLHANSIGDFEADVLRGEVVTRRLLGEKGKEIKYFRYPYLFTGLNLETKAEVSAFLAKNHYTNAPVTIDDADWIFARAYDNAMESGDLASKSAVGKAYIPYMRAKVAYWEAQSDMVLGYEIKQILLIHANSINADYFTELVKMFRKRNYQFITLGEALKDPAFKKPDTFTRRAGISWLHRWALDLGKDSLVPNEPLVPAFVMKLAGVDSE